MDVTDEILDSQEDIGDVVRDFNQNNEISGQGVGGSGERSINPPVVFEIEESDDESTEEEEKDAEDDVNDGEEEVDEIFQRKRKKESSVWKYGTKLKGGSKCNICGKIYKSKQGNTTNLISHIKTKHRHSEAAKELTKDLQEAKEVKKQKFATKEAEKRQQCSLLNFVRRSGTLDKKKKEKITEAVADFIIEDTNYFEVVEKQAFRKMLLLLLSPRRYTMKIRSRMNWRRREGRDMKRKSSD